jgi:mRNA-degrading endonuclease RelE of RelBE toxin-antitoxin system
VSTNKWKIEIRPKAVKQIAKLSPKDRAGVLLSIEQLAEVDNPPLVQGVKYKKGTQNPKEWRQRWGRWRIFFEIRPGKITEVSIEYKDELIIHSVDLDHTGY